ncbi:hypothetical protein [Congregibacter litoralis]|uniref:Uncharacterized protein n=1 Tax=Congregibacter litoralis KT71 TaxID=314285 RepID=V7HVI4_9GAMM|nr:hypothetical protein [Congregibacter litoralis]ESZ89365.1 hypothetical protein KT71_003366 [Congregibacter litoralis KT71]
MNDYVDPSSCNGNYPRGLVSRTCEAAEDLEAANAALEDAREWLAVAQRRERGATIDRTGAESHYNRKVNRLATWVCRCFHIHPFERGLVCAFGAPNARDNQSAAALWIDQYIYELAARLEPPSDYGLFLAVQKHLCRHVPHHQVGNLDDLLDDLLDGMEGE